MARRVRHLHAGRNEWVRVHRGRGSGGGGGGGSILTWIVGILAFTWVVDKVLTFIAENWIAIVSISGGCVTAWAFWFFRGELWIGARASACWIRDILRQGHNRYLKWKSETHATEKARERS
jgi:hypothetical protein